MRIATWNVNSIRSRVERVQDFLQRWDVDVLALQETKCKTEQFPKAAFTELGYEVAAHGINQWNGVALLSRVGLDEVRTDFGQPSFKEVVEPRALSAVCGGVRVWSLYVPHGRGLSDPHFEYKLRWLAALREDVSGRLTADPELAEVLTGDWNIAPYDTDVWDPAAFVDSTHVSPAERAAFFAFATDGLTEVTRACADGFTYWDYQQLRFPKNEGMKIDFMYATPVVASRVAGGFIDRDERKGKGASDHVPVVVDVD